MTSKIQQNTCQGIQENSDWRKVKNWTNRNRDATEQQRFQPMKTVHRIDGWNFRLVMNLVYSSVEEWKVHDPMYGEEIDLVP